MENIHKSDFNVSLLILTLTSFLGEFHFDYYPYFGFFLYLIIFDRMPVCEF